MLDRNTFWEDASLLPEEFSVQLLVGVLCFSFTSCCKLGLILCFAVLPSRLFKGTSSNDHVSKDFALKCYRFKLESNLHAHYYLWTVFCIRWVLSCLIPLRAPSMHTPKMCDLVCRLQISILKPCDFLKTFLYHDMCVFYCVYMRECNDLSISVIVCLFCDKCYLECIFFLK